MTGISQLTFRGFQRDSDFPKMVVLLHDIFMVDQMSLVKTVEELERDYQKLTNCIPEKDMLMVDDATGKLVAYARLTWDKEDERILFGFPYNIHPDWRIPELQHRLLDWVDQHAIEMATSAQLEGPFALRYFLANIDKDVQLKAVLEAHQFQPVRYMNRMSRDLAEPIAVPPLPAGLEARAIEEKDIATVFWALDEAFRDHWGHTPATEENYQQWLGFPLLKPALWQVAWDGDQVASGVLNYTDDHYNEQFGAHRGWTDPIFTRRPWRKQGLARALLMRSLQMFKDMGMTEAMLGVDTQNLSGAYRLYESCGFKSVMHSAIYDKEFTLP